MKKLMALLLVLVMVISMVACTSKETAAPDTANEAPTDATTESTPDAAAETPAAAENVEGTVTICMESAKKSWMEPFAEAFMEKYPNIKVEVLWDKGESTLIAANQAPDILKSGDIHVSGSKNLLLDLTPYLERDAEEVNPDDFFPATLEGLKVDGKQLAMPTSFNVSLLYYNVDLFDEAGLAYPTNDWAQADFVSAGQALTVQEDGKFVQWGCATELGWWGEWLIHVRQAGGDWMSEDGTTCVLDSDEAIKGLEFFYNKTNGGSLGFAPGIADDALGGFAAGKVAMNYGGHTGNWASYNAVEGLNWDIAELPEGSVQKAGAEFAIEGYAISKDTKNAEAAWTFLKYFTGYEGAKLMSELGYPCCRQSVADELLAVPVEERGCPKNLEALYSAIDDAMTLPRNPEFTNCTLTIVQPIIDLMLEGQLTPAEAAKEAAAQANDYLALNG